MIRDLNNKPMFISDRPWSIDWIKQWDQRNYCRGIIEKGALYLFDSHGGTHWGIKRYLGIKEMSTLILYRRYVRIQGDRLETLQWLLRSGMLSESAKMMIVAVAERLKSVALSKINAGVMV